MKNHWLYIPKYEQIKKKPFGQLKKKAASQSRDRLRPIDISMSIPQKKSKSNVKSNQNSVQINLSKSFLNIVHDRIKPLSGKGSSHRQPKDNLSSYTKQYKSASNVPKLGHFQSLDKHHKRQSTQNNNKKSYLIDYLNHKSNQQKLQQRQPPSKLQQPQPQSKLKKQKTKTQIKVKACNSLKYAFRTRKGTLITNPEKPNQDSYLIKSQHQGKHIFAVADGHGAHGHLVSQRMVGSLQKYFMDGLSQFDNGKADMFFQKTYTYLQNQLYESTQFNAHLSGSTLITILINDEYRLTCANVGDSRAILARQIDKKNWEIIHLSEDHKPSVQKQKKRILKKGGKIHSFKDQNGNPIGPQRVWLPNKNMQGLAMSRSMGDNISKPIGVTHQPDIIHLQIQQSDRFILMASDGVWEFIQNYQILQLVVPFYKEGKIEQCCDALEALAYDRWTVEDNNVVDDITFILIFLNTQVLY